MIRRRIRPFNTAGTDPDQRLDNDGAQAVVVRGTLDLLPGRCPQDLDTGEDVTVGEPAAPAHTVMQNIRHLVANAGGRMAHVCKLVVLPDDVVAGAA